MLQAIQLSCGGSFVVYCTRYNKMGWIHSKMLVLDCDKEAASISYLPRGARRTEVMVYVLLWVHCGGWNVSTFVKLATECTYMKTKDLFVLLFV